MITIVESSCILGFIFILIVGFIFILAFTSGKPESTKEEIINKSIQ